MQQLNLYNYNWFGMKRYQIIIVVQFILWKSLNCHVYMCPYAWACKFEFYVMIALGERPWVHLWVHVSSQIKKQQQHAPCILDQPLSSENDRQVSLVWLDHSSSHSLYLRIQNGEEDWSGHTWLQADHQLCRSTSSTYCNNCILSLAHTTIGGGPYPTSVKCSGTLLSPFNLKNVLVAN